MTRTPAWTSYRSDHFVPLAVAVMRSWRQCLRWLWRHVEWLQVRWWRVNRFTCTLMNSAPRTRNKVTPSARAVAALVSETDNTSRKYPGWLFSNGGSSQDMYQRKKAPCGLRGCKNGPAPFPGRMSYKATKPGLVFVLYLSMFYLLCWCLLGPVFMYC